MEQIPFKLSKALFEGAIVKTRKGDDVVIAWFNENVKNPSYAVVGWINGVVESWTIDGMYYDEGEGESDNDLFLIINSDENESED
jgi:hypothetical protein